ncbi:MAG: hypothetical protein EBQ96_00485 [Proteobacteria bacterium]|nr:hypothetical protein [Pseudomonadota bacterium]
MSTQDHEGQRILFLDLEGVMTRGNFRQLSLVATFHYSRDADYSREATRFVARLVSQHGFKVVMITRHARNDSEALQRRLDHAGIRCEWLYKNDPEAIPEDNESKGDPIMDWLARNPAIKITDTIAIDDHGIRTSNGRKPYPQDRVITPDTDNGFVFADFVKAVMLMGDEVPELTQARAGTPRQGQPRQQAR